MILMYAAGAVSAMLGIGCPSGRRVRSDPSAAGLGRRTAGLAGFSLAIGEWRARAEGSRLR
jgi:hypothetical protein